VQLFHGDADAQHGLANYVGSIAIDAASGVVAASSPVGGQVAFWNANGQYLGSTARADGCGVAPLDAGRFMVSDGFGGIVVAAPGADSVSLVQADREVGWDNHLRRA
jgi:hypothetical protein